MATVAAQSEGSLSNIVGIGDDLVDDLLQLVDDRLVGEVAVEQRLAARRDADRYDRDIEVEAAVEEGFEMHVCPKLIGELCDLDRLAHTDKTDVEVYSLVHENPPDAELVVFHRLYGGGNEVGLTREVGPDIVGGP